MQYRTLGGSGLKVPALILGTATFGGGTDFFRKWGETDAREASALVDLARDAGCTMFDTADSYSRGLSEEILGQAVRGRRHDLLIATKTGMAMGPGPNDVGTARSRIIRSCEDSLRRLGTDYIDLYQLHAFDAVTPVDEMLHALDSLTRAGKIRYAGVSNYSGWHLMKMLAASDRLGLPRPVSHQVYYSLVARDFEWELMPLGLDQSVGTLVWSPLAGARLSGKIGRNRPAPADSRAATDATWAVPDDRLYAVTDVLDALAAETGHSVPQIALAWCLGRPGISGIVIGARNADQLRNNLAAADITLTADQIARLDAASDTTPAYPYWHQRRTMSERNPPAV
ncbi:aldo/keto reductase [Tistrella bauzanensis]|uniref:Aldo/keto reductase n=1 Tax=Tistrella bauzanensis TaxID=657419 RepID=A0ABQ1JC46_9PROT|nr:aldo/keto reductase [Tistrella bauzanensis]GGB62988.1 aldo/keto reductase [Tistrella bauzanensis]